MRTLDLHLLCPILLLAVGLPAGGNPTTRPSLSSAGAEANASSLQPAISADGRVVAFASAADNLVPNDTNGCQDVFVRDLASRVTTRVSVASNGAQADAFSRAPALSADGRYVVFASRARNLVPYGTNGMSHIYVHDRVSLTTTLVSKSLLGIMADDDSDLPKISGNGRWVVFQSKAGNLLPGGPNWIEIFLVDLTNGKVERISVSSNNVRGEWPSEAPDVSDDGRFVVFHSAAANLVPNDTNGRTDVFLRDRLTATTTRVSTDPLGREADSGSRSPTIAGDGMAVAFESDATNLVAGDTNGATDVFVWRGVGTTVRASVDSAGAQANNISMFAVLARGGTHVVFTSRATNLAGGWSPYSNVFVRDLALGATTCASRNAGGTHGNADADSGALSGDGHYALFHSAAANLVQDDTNWTDDVFLRDLAPAHPATCTSLGAGCSGSAGVPTLERDPDTLPWIGTRFTLRPSNVPFQAPAFLVLGLSKTSSGGVPLPLDLTALGMTGCTLLVSDDLVLPGAESWSVAIPRSAAAVGARFYTQLAVLDPHANLLGCTLSNALASEVGS